MKKTIFPILASLALALALASAGNTVRAQGLCTSPALWSSGCNKCVDSSIVGKDCAPPSGGVYDSCNNCGCTGGQISCKGTCQAPINDSCASYYKVVSNQCNGACGGCVAGYTLVSGFCVVTVSVAETGASGSYLYKIIHNITPAIGDSLVSISNEATCADNEVPKWSTNKWVCGTAGGTSQWTTTGSDIYYTAGNVGIGIASPVHAKLDIRDTDMVVQVRSTLGSKLGEDPAIVTGFNKGGAIYFGVDNYGIAAMPTAAIETSWGGGTNPQLGIGVTNINSSSHANMLFDSSGTNIRENKTSRLFVQTGGNVGIGTSSPRGTLDVSTPTNNIDGTVIYQTADNTETIQTYIDNQWANRNTYAPGCGSGGCNGLKIQPDAGYVVIGGDTSIVANGSGGMAGAGNLTVAGNVGIGISSPFSGLHIKKDGFPGSFLILDTNAINQDAGLRLNENGVTKWHFYNQGGNSDTLSLQNATSTVLTANQSGRVIIGNDMAVSAKLQVNSAGAGGEGGLFASNNDGVASAFWNNSNSVETVQIWNMSASGKGLYVNAPNNYFSGNVGIGTSSPIRSLHVNGEISISRPDKVAYINVSDVNGSGGGSIVLRGLGTSGTAQVDANISLIGPTTITGNLKVGNYYFDGTGPASTDDGWLRLQNADNGSYKDFAVGKLYTSGNIIAAGNVWDTKQGLAWMGKNGVTNTEIDCADGSFVCGISVGDGWVDSIAIHCCTL